MLRASVFVTASLASLALARTDLTGCTSTDVSSPAGASVAWYVPGTGELCDFLDCGGGRAPPKTTVPGCPLYSGTATYSPSYLPGYGSMTASSGSAAAETTSAVASASESTSYGDSQTTDDLSVVPTLSSTITRTGAWSETSETSAALENGAVTLSTLTSMSSTPTPIVAGNGTSSTSGSGSHSVSDSSSGGNGTVNSGSPSSSSISAAGAMETARVWLGGAGLLGLGAVVVAL